MQHVSAHDAKARFGALLDAARREPVAIEKHGRAVAVVISKEEYDDIEAMKLERLRLEVQMAIDASTAGDVMDVDERDLEKFIERIMTADASISGSR